MSFAPSLTPPFSETEVSPLFSAASLGTAIYPSLFGEGGAGGRGGVVTSPTGRGNSMVPTPTPSVSKDSIREPAPSRHWTHFLWFLHQNLLSPGTLSVSCWNTARDQATRAIPAPLKSIFLTLKSIFHISYFFFWGHRLSSPLPPFFTDEHNKRVWVQSSGSKGASCSGPKAGEPSLSQPCTPAPRIWEASSPLLWWRHSRLPFLCSSPQDQEDAGTLVSLFSV